MRIRQRVLWLALAASVSQVPGIKLLDFEELMPRDPSLEGGFWAPNPGFTSQGVGFSGGSFSGFVVSNATSQDSDEYVFSGGTGEISAFAPPAGGGANGSSQFAVAYNTSIIDLPAGYSPVSVQVTNTTLAYLAMRNGNLFAKFFNIEDQDFFEVIFRGHAEAGGQGSLVNEVRFALADFRFDEVEDTFIVQSWTNVDLSPLAGARSISLAWDSSDTGDFGINTPTYVALDNLQLIPEPGTVLLLLGGVAGLLLHFRKRRG